jgi:hypothetical protein
MAIKRKCPDLLILVSYQKSSLVPRLDTRSNGASQCSHSLPRPSFSHFSFLTTARSPEIVRCFFLVQLQLKLILTSVGTNCQLACRHSCNNLQLFSAMYTTDRSPSSIGRLEKSLHVAHIGRLLAGSHLRLAAAADFDRDLLRRLIRSKITREE